MSIHDGSCNDQMQWGPRGKVALWFLELAVPGQGWPGALGWSMQLCGAGCSEVMCFFCVFISFAFLGHMDMFFFVFNAGNDQRTILFINVFKET